MVKTTEQHNIYAIVIFYLLKISEKRTYKIKNIVFFKLKVNL